MLVGKCRMAVKMMVEMFRCTMLYVCEEQVSVFKANARDPYYANALDVMQGLYAAST